MPSRTAAAAVCALAITALLVVISLAIAEPQGHRVVVIVLAAMLVGLVAVYARTLRRVTSLSILVERVASGDLDVVIHQPRSDTIGRLERAINLTTERLVETHAAATIDRLTQIANRAAVLAVLHDEVGRAARHDRPLSIGFVDIDHFKDVNDNYGHHVGDVVLRTVGDLFHRNLRSSDTVGRFGGEEFMLVLPETTPEAAAEVAEKCRMLVERHPFENAQGERIVVTVSIGIAGGRGAAIHAEGLERAADQAMYAAKSLGRNQTYIFREPDDDARVPGAPISPNGRARAMEIGAIGRRAAEVALSAIVAPLPHYGGSPSPLIATIAMAMANELDLPPLEIERIRVASLLHDIGKIAVPGDILGKPAPLTDTEWSFVRQHPRIGQLIIDEAGGLRDAGKIILHHHERFGGHGYPHGLRGKAIPLGSRIVAIADAYDAMIHDRPYKAAMGHDQSLAEMRRHSATQFDPELVDLFIRRFGERPPVADPSLATPIDPEAVIDLRTVRRITA